MIHLIVTTKNAVHSEDQFPMVVTTVGRDTRFNHKKQSSPKRGPRDATYLERRPSSLNNGDFIIKPSCYVAISVENIKLVYLKQSMAKELSK